MSATLGKLFSVLAVSYFMNLRTTFTTVAAMVALTSISHAESKRTAEYILSDPMTYQNKEVTLDVAFVKPVHWVSPYAGFAFFHAITIDRTDKKPGGAILVAVPIGDSAKFAKKFGTDFDGRNDKDTLRGEFLAAGSARHRQIWLVDTTGKLAEVMAAQKKDFPEESMEGDLGGGPKGGKGFGGHRGEPR